MGESAAMLGSDPHVGLALGSREWSEQLSLHSPSWARLTKPPLVVKPDGTLGTRKLSTKHTEKHFPKRCEEDGAESSLPSSPGWGEEKKTWVLGRSVPGIKHLAYKPQERGGGASQQQLQSSSLPALAMTGLDGSCPCMRPQRPQVSSPCLSVASDKGCS